MDLFNSPTEEIKTIASQALGAVGAGNIEKYLPILLDEIKSQPKRQYLMLHSLKEVNLSDFFTLIIDFLGHCQSEHRRRDQRCN